MSKAYHSRTVVSVPRPPATKMLVLRLLDKNRKNIIAVFGGRKFTCWSTRHGDPVLLWFAILFTPLHKGRGKPCASTVRGRGCYLLAGVRGTETPYYYGLQGYSLPSIRGGGSRASGAGEGLLFVIIRNIFSEYNYTLLLIS